MPKNICIYPYFFIFLIFLSDGKSADLSDLTYTDFDWSDEVRITDCKETVSGKMVIPAEINGKRVYAIKEGAFGNCNLLNQIIIPDTVNEIEDNAFYGCDGLTEIIIPDSVGRDGGNGTLLGSGTFGSCDSLRFVTIGNNIEYIGEGAFSSCKNLTQVNLGNSINYIDDKAFYSCEKLTTINFPESLERIDEDAFRGAKFVNLYFPDKVRVIQKNAFDGTQLKTVSFGKGIEFINRGAFPSCSIESITFRGNAPKNIYDDSFRSLDYTWPEKERVCKLYGHDYPLPKIFVNPDATGFDQDSFPYRDFISTDPTNPVDPVDPVDPSKSVQLITNLTRRENIFTGQLKSVSLTFISNVNSNYTIQRSIDLQNWESLRDITGQENTTMFTDTRPDKISKKMFYRVLESK